MKGFFTTLFLCQLILSCQKPTQSQPQGFLDGPETIFLDKGESAPGLLIIIPGANLAPKDYKNLGQTIAAGTPMSVSIPGFLGNFPNPLQIKSKVEATITLAKKTKPNLTNKMVFVAGHSLGGIMARTAAKELDVGGLILLGSYLPKSPMAGTDKIQEFPIPVLTLGGSLDGLTRLTYIAREYSHYLESLQNQPSEKYRKPVLLFQDINHSHFAHGGPLHKDISSPLKTEDAHKLLADHMIAFINLNGQGPTSEKDKQLLDLALEQTESQLRGFLTALDQDKELCVRSQRSFSGLNEPELSQVQIKLETYDNGLAFLNSKPHATVIDGANVLDVKEISKLPTNLMDVSETQISPLWISCKSKSSEAISARFNIPTQDNGTTCAQINQETIEGAKSLLTPSQLTLFEATGRDIKTGDDITYQTGVTWSSSSLQFVKDDAGSVTIASPSLSTSNDINPQQFAGMRYCLHLSPSRAMEWMLVESLK